MSNSQIEYFRENQNFEILNTSKFARFYDRSDAVMQAGVNMYPGETWCNPVIPHAKWHVETSIALTDFVFLSDELYRILGKYNNV